jgi:dephospho-CoA kinase
MSAAPTSSKPVVIGVVGGIASGKSEVTRMLSTMNATVISADEIAHRVLLEPDVIGALVDIFGVGILHEQPSAPDQARTINRKSLGSMVFGDSDEKRVMRRKLESIVHPRIRQIAREELATRLLDTSRPLIVLDAPLLIEGGWLSYCNRVLFVDSPDAMRKKRAMERGWTEQEWLDRESAQLSFAEKRKFATDILVNDGTLIQLQQRVVDFVANLVSK